MPITGPNWYNSQYSSSAKPAMGRQAVLLQAMDAWPLSCPPAQEMCVELHRNVCEHASGFLRRSGSFPKAKENAQANL